MRSIPAATVTAQRDPLTRRLAPDTFGAAIILGMSGLGTDAGTSCPPAVEEIPMTALRTLIARRVHEPDDRLIEQLGRTDGDLVVLGAAGKMGVSLARMAAEAFDRLP